MKFIGYRTLKTAIGAAISIIISKYIGLEYAVSAGIITILSIQNTKRKSVEIAFQRICACVLALGIAFITFNLFGYREISFSIFLLVFIPFAVKFNIGEGIVVSSVLVTHLLVQKSVETFWLKNELKLMITGAFVALILNLYMPSIEDKIRNDKIYIEEMMKEILHKMSIALKNHTYSFDTDDLFDGLQDRLEEALKRSYINFNNYVFQNEIYYVHYMEMRIKQFETIKRMKEHFQRFFMTYEQAIMISNFTQQVANLLYEDNTAEGLIGELNKLRLVFKQMPLPKDREEFENRAMLFQFLNDMETFLIIKKEFRKNINK
ncbi:aromatic acid exporter family protein [Tepidibacter aestuarii]|uniref:aromatic acid exporter family protein n=1 Tax=Tepidibacter aestuarii TaxID=2925782 RepID=UPI0020BFC5AD|nr:aromatic acid exporter family protein [Tepidibacter aestuarii]CAH2213590.1 Aromatic acid exporter family protein [Tepidibacter aestuarii]